MRVWTRDEWGAAPPRSVTWMETPVNLAVVHHTVSAWPATPDAAAETCRQIQAYHQNVQGWADIGYSFLVGAGDVFTGRGWQAAQAAQQGYNNVALSFAIIGDGSEQAASRQDLEAVAAVIRSGIALGALTTDCSVVPHGALNATACCGSYIIDQLPIIIDLIHGEDPVTPTEQVVADLYRLWALRPGDPEGIRYWAGELDAGRINTDWLANRMFHDEGWRRMVERTGGLG